MGMEYLDRVVEVSTFSSKERPLRRIIVGQVRLAPHDGEVLVDTGRGHIRVPVDQLDGESVSRIIACGRSDTEPGRCECEDSGCTYGGRCGRIGCVELDGVLLCRVCLMYIDANA